MGCKSCSTHNDAEEALWYAMHPLLCNPDEHVLSTIGALVLVLLEGGTDLPISGVFGAGKTRSAAILVVGLLVFEPNLNLMIITKENVAAQACAEHIEALGLPPSITSKIGRLVGYMELKKNKTNKTTLQGRRSPVFSFGTPDCEVCGLCWACHGQIFGSPECKVCGLCWTYETYQRKNPVTLLRSSS